MRKILALLLVTTSVLAQDASRVLTGSAQPPLPFSIVPQPGFEARTTGWSVTSGTFTTTADVVPTSPTAVARGRYSGKWTPPVSTGAGVILQSDQATIPAGLLGHQCRSQILYKGAALTNGAMTYEVFDGTNILGTFALSDVTGYTYAQTGTFSCPSSGTLRIRIRSTSTTPSTTTPLYFDEAFLGDVNALSVGSPVTATNPFGSSPNAAGASVGSSTITLQPADATNPGGVSTVAQSFAGQKTFIDQIIGSITGNAGTATAFFANPTDCSAGQYASASDAAGNLTCSVPPGVTPITTKGDLYTFDTAVSRLPVGANNFCLVADSAESKGIKWASCGTGGPGGMGIGYPITAASPNRILYSDASGTLQDSSKLAFVESLGELTVDASTSDPSSTIAPINSLYTANYTSNSTEGAYGVYSVVEKTGSGSLSGGAILLGGEFSAINSGSGDPGGIYGGRFTAFNNMSGAGTTNSVVGLQTSAGVATNGVTADAYSLLVSSPSSSGSATITNSYGIYINEGNAGVTNNYSLWVNGGKSYFGGPISQDGAADAVQVNIQGHSTQTTNILNIEKSDGTDLLSVTNTAGTLIRGTTTNDAAATGFVGEFISANVSGTVIPAASNVSVNLATITLTAGDWDVDGVLSLDLGATSAITIYLGGISLTAASNDSLVLGGVTFGGQSLVANRNYAWPLSSRRISVSATTDVHLTGNITYTVLGGATWGNRSRIQARRVR